MHSPWRVAPENTVQAGADFVRLVHALRKLLSRGCQVAKVLYFLAQDFQLLL
jgi:hypothetical protein